MMYYFVRSGNWKAAVLAPVLLLWPQAPPHVQFTQPVKASAADYGVGEFDRVLFSPSKTSEINYSPGICESRLGIK